jgi:hypothetical protein
VEELKEPLQKASAHIFAKKNFSMVIPEVEILLDSWKPKSIILVGIEVSI